ncbi:hypothetical protein DUI87_05349 [Hirundo rustica rustica]|uniref:Uncharacterized protein n=1 Tax=Hirundo rustica rustica TaxID=333673 RepID=A0A3M0KWZ6_HIRRU|nr:hypothetical protein DUI87_05349 [Hirundo rustica rustica]
MHEAPAVPSPNTCLGGGLTPPLLSQSSQAALCCQGMMKVWLEAVQGMLCEDLPLSIFSSSLHSSTVPKPYQEERADEGCHRRFGNYLILAFTFCYHRGGTSLHHWDMIHQKMPVTLPNTVSIDEKKALLPSTFKLQFPLRS